MATKRARSPELVANPFIKKRNLEWSLELTGPPLDAKTDSSEASSSIRISPPLTSNKRQEAGVLSKTAAVEAGDAEVTDHLEYFSTLLSKTVINPYPARTPNLTIPAWQALYDTNAGSRSGAHFVVHQHDHPIAGTHYDLRLQINETSSVSWAIMYGLPGDPNGRRLNRNATETRVHCLWNHLIETASASTGSLIIWDTGTYEVLDRRSKHAPVEDPDSQQQQRELLGGDDEDGPQSMTQQERLHRAFQSRKIKLKLSGTRLPRNYVLNLRLTKDEDVAGRAKSGRKPKTRRRRGGGGGMQTRSRKKAEPMTSSDSDSERGDKAAVAAAAEGGDDDDDNETVRAPVEQDQEGISAMERELRELEDEQVRRTNAYLGATNSIDSVHQRKWFLSVDREASGFVKRRKAGRVVWEREEPDSPQDQAEADEGGGDDADDVRLGFPFYVQGVEVERSILTGRQGADVLRDEGVLDFVGRKGWQAVVK